MWLFHEFIWPFHAVVFAHILTGSIGLVAFWVPVVAKKGGSRHKAWGRVFTLSMLLTGAIAVGIASLTLADPIGTHPHLDFPEPLIAGIFGWMMLYLALLTMNLAWYGWECIQLRGNHAGHRSVLNFASQAILFLASLNCAIRGAQLDQILMVGISVVGFATVATNLRFMLRVAPGPQDWLKEHLKGLVGAGISVYTAFLAFGAVRLMPELALNPGLWAIPLVTGLSIILYHWRKIWRMEAALRARRQGVVAAD